MYGGLALTLLLFGLQVRHFERDNGSGSTKLWTQTPAAMARVPE